jgi:hypothetical protein
MPLLQDRLEQMDSAVKTYKQVLAITKMNQGNNKDRHNYFHSFSMKNSFKTIGQKLSINPQNP